MLGAIIINEHCNWDFDQFTTDAVVVAVGFGDSIDVFKEQIGGYCFAFAVVPMDITIAVAGVVAGATHPLHLSLRVQLSYFSPFSKNSTIK